MDMQELINQINENSKIESGKEYNLGMLIKDLKQYSEEFLTVEFDDGSVPTDFDGWRGSYCELALGYKKDKIMHINTFFRKAFNINNSIVEGYKGGEFLIDLDTPIHQANYGETGVYLGNGDYVYKKIIGVKKEKDKVIIITKIEED